MSAAVAALNDDLAVSNAAESSELHASCVSFLGRGLLLRGLSGAGKSDLALRLIATGADLVADDRVALVRRGDRLLASRPSRAVQGLLELRRQGIVALPAAPRCALALVLDLTSGDATERLPEPRAVRLLGIELPAADLDAHAASAVPRIVTLLLGRRTA